MIKTNFKLYLAAFYIMSYALLRFKIFILKIIKEFKQNKMDNNYEDFEKTHKNKINHFNNSIKQSKFSQKIVPVL